MIVTLHDITCSLLISKGVPSNNLKNNDQPILIIIKATYISVACVVFGVSEMSSDRHYAHVLPPSELTLRTPPKSTFSTNISQSLDTF